MKIALTILLLQTWVTGQIRPGVNPRRHVPPVVRLLEAGTGPKTLLRYNLKGPQQLTAVAGGEFTMQNPAGSNRVVYPTLTTPLKLTPVKGAVTWTWLKSSYVYPPGFERPDPVTPALLDSLEGSTGGLVMDARGIISEINLRISPKDEAASTDGMQKKSLYATEMGKGILQLLSVPLPEEPVGIGARWQTERIAVHGQLSYLQFNTYTLVKREGDTLELTYRFGGNPDPSFGLREGEIKLEVSGGGKCTLKLNLPMPVALEDEVNIYALMTNQDGQHTEQSNRVATKVESK